MHFRSLEHGMCCRSVRTGGIAALLFFTIPASAEVFLSGIPSLLPSGNSSVVAVPGGVRRMCLNMSCYSAARVISGPEGALEFERKWDELQRTNGLDISSVGLSLQEEADGMVGPDLGFFARISAFTNAYRNHKQNVKRFIELPFSFESGGWKIIAKLPMAVIDATVGMSDTPVTDGYIMMRDVESERRALDGFWRLKFEPGFNLVQAIRDYSEEDAPGSDPQYVDRPPDSIRTLHLQEDADGWATTTWIYEGSGSVNQLARHYRARLVSDDYRTSAPDIRSDNGAILQYRNHKLKHDLVINVAKDVRTQNSVQTVIQISVDS